MKKLVKGSERKIHRPKNNPCIGCHTDCCKSYAVHVNAHDIYNIHNEFKIKPENFIDLHNSSDKDHGVKLTGGIYDLALKKRGDGCMFLIEIGSEFRCGIDMFKPGACKAYPFDPSEEKLTQLGDKLCPIDWKVTKDFGNIMTTFLNKYRKEWYFYYDLILEWNASKQSSRTLSSFIKFIFTHVENIKS